MNADDPAALAKLRDWFDNGIPFNRVLGIEVVELSRGVARFRVPFRQELIGDRDRPALHGGVLSATMDACGGAAGMTLLGDGERLSTLDLRIDYLRPGEPKELLCRAEVVRIGNRVASIDIVCFHGDDPDRLIATGKGVYSLHRG